MGPDPDGDDELRRSFLGDFLQQINGLILLAWVPAPLMLLAAVIIYFTEDSSPLRFVATAGFGIVLSLALHGLLRFAGFSAKRELAVKQQSKWHARIAWILLFAGGAAMATWGAVQVADEMDYRTRAVTTIAEVVSTSRSGPDGDSGVIGTVRVTTDDGEVVTAKMDPLPTADVDGASIRVRYDEADPQDVRAAYLPGIWGLPLMALAFGLWLAGYCVYKSVRTGAWRST